MGSRFYSEIFTFITVTFLLATPFVFINSNKSNTNVYDKTEEKGLGDKVNCILLAGMLLRWQKL